MHPMPEFAVESTGALCAETLHSRNRIPKYLQRDFFVTRMMSVNCTILEVRLDFFFKGTNVTKKTNHCPCVQGLGKNLGKATKGHLCVNVSET